MKGKDLVLNLDKDYEVKSINFDSLKKLSQVIDDLEYLEFINNINGGFFYNSSLQLYSFCNTSNMEDIFYVNNFINEEYGLLVEGLFSFGQEIFGNQFCFSKEGIIFLNIESGEKEIIASNFSEWCSIIQNDLDYYTGKAFSTFLNSKNIEKKARICPKIPFIIGGEYRVSNFYHLFFPDYIQANYNIAKQVHDLPDGSEIKFKIIS